MGGLHGLADDSLIDDRGLEFGHLDIAASYAAVGGPSAGGGLVDLAFRAGPVVPVDGRLAPGFLLKRNVQYANVPKQS